VINFRYHVVSLISVFLALAVGIILGAGPLKEAIGDQLTGQVAALRSEKEQLRSQLGDAQTSADQEATAIKAYAPGVLADTLTGAEVTIVEVSPGLDQEFKNVSTQLKAAGAKVGGRVVVQSSWLSEAGEPAREQAAAKIAGSGLAIDESATPDQQLAQGLVLALTTESGPGHKLTAPATDALRTLDDAGLVAIERTPTVASTDVVVLAGASTAAPSDATPAPDSQALGYARDREEEILTATHAVLPGTVVGGPASSPDGLVAAVRSDGDLQELVSTVSGVDTVVGQVNVPLALADQVAGTVGHYGFDDGASQPVPNLPSRVTTSSSPTAQEKH
jgi:hypothetical protein